ncbi:P-granule-associated novel protein 1 [Tribolium castaneum]|uniref:Leucine-rich repeat and immunoglobulin-like domain containing-NOGO receptor-interacting protein 4 n=1 Tax=Tribolium castaneum TaxID=7070 RepID=D6WKA9_TRICA|nr:PREDICTED: carboxypeptidase N subunit 2 [Tribolium castaneum]EFA03970.1 Leucine-rich repeat and immunoglobulin-like domain containing-NOGO receptor-interacting protein 4 [Tribolium castaneum]|eukprot:XP_008193253.1 PREDICTED: carboxypeptidase N subunit 2 [Tribolium castaneum]
MLIKAAYLILLAIGSFNRIYGHCEESYMMFCDCVSDIRNYKSGNWTDVVIKSGKTSCSSAIKSNSFEKLDEIKILFIVDQIETIEKFAFKQIGQTLKVLKLYGNALNLVKSGTFSGFRKLSQLSLVNNNIELIEEKSFESSVIKNLDLSRNKIEMIAADTFAESEITKIVLRYNRLSYINEDAFNKHLEILQLDYNNLEHLQGGFASKSPKLRELTISHNKLSHVSDVPSLVKANKLDFSFNNINHINLPEFEDFKDLTFLDLSSNKLETFSLNYFKKVKTERLTLLLSYNLLTNVKFKDDTKPMTLTLFGNPWNCKCLEKMQKHMLQNNFSTTKCDLELFKCGLLPVCIEQGECEDSQPVENRDDLKRFMQVVQRQKGSLVCDVFRDTGPRFVVGIRSR